MPHNRQDAFKHATSVAGNINIQPKYTATGNREYVPHTCMQEIAIQPSRSRKIPTQLNWNERVSYSYIRHSTRYGPCLSRWMVTCDSRFCSELICPCSLHRVWFIGLILVGSSADSPGVQFACNSLCEFLCVF